MLEGDVQLTPAQLAYVRRPEFKQWFGDWENSPQTASKLLDTRSGEPLVCLHGTRADFETFDRQQVRDGGFFFTASLGIAKLYGNDSNSWNKDGKVKQCFIRAHKVLDLREPYEADDATQQFIDDYAAGYQADDWENERYYRDNNDLDDDEELDEYPAKPMWVDRTTDEEQDVRDFLANGTLFDYEGDWSSERWRDLMNTAEAAGYDAVLAVDHNGQYADSISIIVFDAANIRPVPPATVQENRLLTYAQFRG